MSGKISVSYTLFLCTQEVVPFLCLAYSRSGGAQQSWESWTLELKDEVPREGYSGFPDRRKHLGCFFFFGFQLALNQ